MAVAVELFARLLESLAVTEAVTVERITIAGPTRNRTALYHLLRVARVALATKRILFTRGATVYVSVDAGLGMLYTLVLACAARVANAHMYLHHHSAAYLREPTTVFEAVCRVAPESTRHLVGCEAMATMLRLAFPDADAVVLPILYAVEGRARTMERNPHKPLVIGHLSNVSREKGIEDVFGTVETLLARGASCQALIAGPAATPADQELIDAGLRATRGVSRYLGPIHGTERERFFDEIDLFLFPSRYVHESFGLVVGEALARGCAVVTRDTICLDQELVGDAGLVLGAEVDFCQAAADWVDRLSADPAERARVDRGIARFVRKRDDAIGQSRHVAHEILYPAES